MPLTLHSRVPRDFTRFGEPGYAWAFDDNHDAYMTGVTNLIPGQCWLRDANGDLYPNNPSNVVYDPVWEFDGDDNLILKAA